MKVSTGILYCDYYHYIDNSVIQSNKIVTSVYVGIDLSDEPIYDTRLINSYGRITGLTFHEK
jgi:hypothetical protein